MKQLAKIAALVGLILGGSSCEVILPLSVMGTTGATVLGMTYIIANADSRKQVVENDKQKSEESHVTSIVDQGAHKVVTKQDGSTTTIVDHGAHKFIHSSDGTTSTVIDHGAHKIVHNSDGTTTTVVDHGAHKVVIKPDGTHEIVVVH